MLNALRRPIRTPTRIALCVSPLICAACATTPAPDRPGILNQDDQSTTADQPQVLNITTPEELAQMESLARLVEQETAMRTLAESVPDPLEPLPDETPADALAQNTSAPDATAETPDTTDSDIDHADHADDTTLDQPPAPIEPTPPAVLTFADHARALAQALENKAISSADPFGPALQLLALKVIDPASASLGLTIVAPTLSPLERAAFDRFAVLLTALRPNADSDNATAPLAPLSPDAIDAAIITAAETIRSTSTISIADAQLCRSVSSFGVYAPFASTTFKAGSPRPVIVYAEIDGMRYQPTNDAQGKPMHEIELSVELTLTRRADGVMARKSSPAIISDVSRRKRRDFFLTSRFELPATMTIGLYDLKVTVTDLNNPGAQAEFLIPITATAP